VSQKIMPLRVRMSRVEVCKAIESLAADRHAGCSGVVDKGFVWWLSVTPSTFAARYERLRFFVQIRGDVAEAPDGSTQITVAVRLEPLAIVLLVAITMMMGTYQLTMPLTPLSVIVGAGSVILVSAIGWSAWRGAKDFVNIRLLPRLRDLTAGAAGPLST
jgi:hypothetical protein